MMNRKNCTYNPITKILKGKTRLPIYNVNANLGYLVLEKLYMNPLKINQISDDTGRVLTNLQMYERSLKFANHLKTKLMLKQHDVFGLIASNTENLTPVIFGCLILGVAINPLAMQMGVEEIVEIWSSTKPKVIFCDGKMVDIVKVAVNEMNLDAKIYTMKQRRAGYIHADDILEEDYEIGSFDFPELPDIASTTAFINCSSGTTGSPKTICKSHNNMISRAILYFDRDLNGNDLYFNLDQSYWTVHQGFLIQCTLYDIPVLVSSEPFEPNAFMDIVDRHQVTATTISPPQCLLLIKNPNVRKLHSIRFLILVGAAFTQDLIQSVNAIIPNGKALTAYGSTEGGAASVSNGSEGIFGLSSGYINYNLQLKVIDDHGNALGPNQVGEIRYKPVGIPCKYYNDPDTTAKLYDSDGFLISGDLGYFDDFGRVYVVDRIKNMIKVSDDYVVTPGEIEKHINEIDGVIESKVIGIFDQKLFYDRIWAFVVRKEGQNDVTKEKIMDHMEKNAMKEKMITGDVHFVDKIPRNTNGKILNRVMREMAAEFMEKMAIK